MLVNARGIELPNKNITKKEIASLQALKPSINIIKFDLKKIALLEE